MKTIALLVEVETDADQESSAACVHDLLNARKAFAAVRVVAVAGPRLPLDAAAAMAEVLVERFRAMNLDALATRACELHQAILTQQDKDPATVAEVERLRVENEWLRRQIGIGQEQ